MSDALRYRRAAEHLHRLGPRATAELLAEIAEAHGIEDEVLARLDRWRLLRPEVVAAVLAGRQFPPALQVLPR